MYVPQTNVKWITNNSRRPAGRARETICVYHSGAIYFTPYDQGWKEDSDEESDEDSDGDSDEDSDEETVVWNESDELRTSGHTIDGLRWSDPVEGQTDTTNINEPNWGDGDGSSSDDGELGIWRDSVGKTL